MHFHRRGWALGSALGAAVLTVLIIYPLSMLLIQIVLPNLFAVHMNTNPSFAPVWSAIRNPINLEALCNSLGMALGGALIAAGVGLVTSLAEAQSRSRMGRLLIDLFVWVVLFTPSYIIAQGWVVFMQDGGVLSQLFHWQNGWSNWFFTPIGLTFVMGLKYFPFIHLAMVQAMDNVGLEYSHAAQMNGANRSQVWFHILLPMMMPGLLAGMSIAFAEGFGDFGFAAAIIPTTNLPLVSYQIYSAMSQAPVEFSTAALMSLALILITASALGLQFWWLSRRSYATVSSSSRPGQFIVTGRWIYLVASVLMVLSLVFPVGSSLIVSMWKNFSGGMMPDNWTLSHYGHLLTPASSTFQALWASMKYGFVAASSSTVLALWLGYQLTFHRSAANQILNLITMASIAVPGVVFAAGYIFAWNASWMHALHFVIYGTSTGLALAYIAGHIPYATRLQYGAMSQLSPNLLAAARLFGARESRVMVGIVAPLMRITILSTFFLTFTQTIFELPASMLLYPPGAPTLSVVAQVQFSAFNWPQGSAIAIVGMAVVLASYAAGRRLSGAASL